MSFLSIVIPVYNSQDTLPEHARRIIETLNQTQYTPREYEVIYVDDCSNDESWHVIESIRHKSNNIIGIQLAKNAGQHAALLCGIQAARGDLIVTIDDDLQQPPEAIPELLREVNLGYDVVYGVPKTKSESFARSMASRLTKSVLDKTAGSGNQIKLITPFRCFTRRASISLLDYRSTTIDIDVALSWSSSKYSYVPVEFQHRRSGRSGYNITRLARHTINLLTGFSTRPLRISSVYGLLLSGAGMACLIYLCISWVAHGSTVPGFMFLATALCIFSGAQLVALGIIGEYLARIYTRSMNKPSYTIRRKTWEQYHG